MNHGRNQKTSFDEMTFQVNLRMRKCLKLLKVDFISKEGRLTPPESLRYANSLYVKDIDDGPLPIDL